MKKSLIVLFTIALVYWALFHGPDIIALLVVSSIGLSFALALFHIAKVKWIYLVLLTSEVLLTNFFFSLFFYEHLFTNDFTTSVMYSIQNLFHLSLMNVSWESLSFYVKVACVSESILGYFFLLNGVAFVFKLSRNRTQSISDD